MGIDTTVAANAKSSFGDHAHDRAGNVSATTRGEALYHTKSPLITASRRKGADVVRDGTLERARGGAPTKKKGRSGGPLRDGILEKARGGESTTNTKKTGAPVRDGALDNARGAASKGAKAK